jgi:hypothetical protein
MNCLTKQHQQRNARAHARTSAPARWRIGNANVSTEELQAWQLGPARIERWLDVPTRPARG